MLLKLTVVTLFSYNYMCLNDIITTMNNTFLIALKVIEFFKISGHPPIDRINKVKDHDSALVEVEIRAVKCRTM